MGYSLSLFLSSSLTCFFQRTELRKLVADARRGDRFFFHCRFRRIILLRYRSIFRTSDSGHVVQTENQDHTEEDGKDECKSSVMVHTSL